MRGYVLNTLLADKMVDDRLRSYPHWLASRNLANEASDESVQALVEAVRGRYELPRRWYRLKAQLLGVDRLADYDRMAAVTDDDEPIAVGRRASDIVLDSFAGFSPELADIGARASSTSAGSTRPVRPGKRGGAFCSYTVPSARAVRDAQLHRAPPRRADARARARPRRPRGAGAPAGRVPLRDAADAGRDRERVRRDARVRPPARRGADAGVASSALLAGVDRGLDRDRLPPGRDEPLRAPRPHRAPRARASCRSTASATLWAQSQEELLGDAVEVTEGYRTWWSYVPHFINTPGYVYAYAYGQLLALAVYGRYEEEGEASPPPTSSCCARAARMPPEELGEIVGIDLADPGFWDRGLDLVERQLEAAEQAARDAGRI